MQDALFARITRRMANSPLGRAIYRAAAEIKETDQTFFGGKSMSALYRNRLDYDRDKVLKETLRAWRVNPMARRIVKLTSQFVIGKGIVIQSKNKHTDKFLKSWLNHPLNRISAHFSSWMDELTRTGNMFILYTIDTTTGMSFVRAVAADTIKEIQTASNDIEQETYFIPHNIEASPYESYDPLKAQNTFMLHFAVNRPVGTTWGESDLAPMLPWLGRYASIIEDRVRLNRYRNAFLYIVQGQFKSKAEKKDRETELNANPPQPGSILVTDPTEQWSVISPKLDSSDANTDILNLKKMIAIGTPFPLHYLAEPESSTTTTAEAAGTPTFRGLQDIQRDFCAMIETLAIVAIETQNRYATRKLTIDIEVKPQDISERDNAILALAGTRIYPILANMYDRQLLDAEKLIDITFKFIGESPQNKTN